MKTILGWLLFLGLIAVPITRYFLEWHRYSIIEKFEDEFQMYGVQRNFNYDSSHKLNLDYWKHHRVVYLPFIYKNRAVSIRRYVCSTEYTLYNKKTLFTYHGDINIII